MDQPVAPPDLALPGSRWSDVRWLTLLLVLTLAIRVWQVTTTEMTTRDSVGYARAAWRMGEEPWLQVVREGPQHPGYSALIALMSWPVRAVLPEDLPRAMQLSAQLVSVLASLLLLLPLYYLGKELFDGRVGFWAALLIQVLPSTGRMMPDGLSEPVFLLLVSTSLYCAVRGLRTGRTIWLLLTGLVSGLAYLTRTEGLLVPAVTVLVLLGLQASRQWSRPLPWLVRATLGVMAGCALFALPFMLLIGGISLKSSMKHMLDPHGWKIPGRPPAAAAVRAPLPLAVWNIGPDVRPVDRYGWSLWALVSVLDKAYFHVLGPLVMLGLWWSRGRFAQVPGAWLLLVSGGLLLLLLYKLGQSNGYIGERHVVLLVVGGVYFAVAGIAHLASLLGRWWPRVSPGWLATGFLVAFTTVCLGRTLAPLHGNRAGFREAGLWLAANTLPGDRIEDPLTWTAYFAGRTFQRAHADLPRSNPPVAYIVLENSDNSHPHLWYLLDPLRKATEGRTPVYRHLVRRGSKHAEIAIYRVELDAAGQPKALPLVRAPGG